uniref:Si:dkey-31g6.4 n=1 Tax=Astyanax mexicanus TaxID=7994 RepID=A0A3B1JA30_ASTMX
EEDWEKEIEEFSHRMKQEKMKEMPYPEDELKVAMDEMTLYAVPRAPMPNQDHYSPSKHHVPPVKWTRYIYTKVPDQFKDAEE